MALEYLIQDREKYSSKNEKKIIGIFDLDETLRRRKTFELFFYNSFFKNKIQKSEIGALEKYLVAVSEFIFKYAPYGDLSKIAKELSNIGENYIYTLNSPDVTESFLRDYNLEPYFSDIIITKKKTFIDLLDNLKNLRKSSEEELDNHAYFAFGDSYSDLMCVDGFKENYKFGILSKFDKAPVLREISDVLIDHTSKKENTDFRDILDKINSLLVSNL